MRGHANAAGVTSLVKAANFPARIWAGLGSAFFREGTTLGRCGKKRGTTSKENPGSANAPVQTQDANGRRPKISARALQKRVNTSHRYRKRQERHLATSRPCAPRRCVDLRHAEQKALAK